MYKMLTVFIGSERDNSFYWWREAREGERERRVGGGGDRETETERDRQRENSKTLILKDSSIRSKQPVLAILQTQISTTILQTHNYEHE